MRRGESLTGGTGDVNPQSLLIVGTQLTVNGSYGNAVQLPISRVPSRSGRATVVELIKASLHVSVPAQVALNNTGNQFFGYHVQLSTKNLGSISAADPTVFYLQRETFTYYQPGTAQALSCKWAPQPLVQDYEDGAGHGLLLATDSIWVYFITDNFALQSSFFLRLYYRFKNVSLEEYIGIVQSQQA